MATQNTHISIAPKGGEFISGSSGSPNTGGYFVDPRIFDTMDGHKWEEVSIRRVANGFIVVIGCKTFVAEKWEKVATALAEYWKDPKAAEKKYCKK